MGSGKPSSGLGEGLPGPGDQPTVSGLPSRWLPHTEHLLCAWPRAVKTHSILQAGKQAESTARAAVGCGVRAHHSGSRAGLPNPWTALLPV